MREPLLLFTRRLNVYALRAVQSPDVVVRQHGPHYYPDWNTCPRVLLPNAPVRPSGSSSSFQSWLNTNFRHAIATILCFGALGGVATAFISTMGPKTGLRTMIITRFSSGYFGGTIYSILNILTQ